MGNHIAYLLFLLIHVIVGRADMICEPFPHIDNGNYLKYLSNHVEKSKDGFGVMVIVGPKDAGKSEGLSTMQKEWEKLNYLVVEVNLKGQSHIISGKEVMTMVSKVLNKELNAFGYLTYLQLYYETIEICLNPNITMWGWLTIFAMDFFPALCGTTILIYVIRKVRDIIMWCLQYNCLIWILMLILVAALLLYYILWKKSTFLYMILQPYDVSVSNGDWSTLICFLNVIATMQPDHRPILIIKEIVNMDHQCLQECMRSLEQAKEGKIHYPIILETSDNMWFNITAIKTSRSAFQTYYVSEMSYKEGYDDLVTLLNIWTPEEYNVIYKTLGGHTGSYKLLWSLVKCYEHTLQSALNYMVQATRSHLLECILQSTRLTSDVNATMIVNFLRVLKSNKYLYMMQPDDISSVLKYLFEYNILFFNGTDVFPQKKLMEIAIEHYLSFSVPYN